MPGRETMNAQERAETASRTIALREAVRVGIADIEAGRYQDFRTSCDLARHLQGMLNRIMSGRIGTR